MMTGPLYEVSKATSIEGEKIIKLVITQDTGGYWYFVFCALMAVLRSLDYLGVPIQFALGGE